jgi:hypothetical protein
MGCVPCMTFSSDKYQYNESSLHTEITKKERPDVPSISEGVDFVGSKR